MDERRVIADQRRTATSSAWLLLPLVILMAVALPLRYVLTLAEPDLVWMMAALVYGDATGLHEAAGQHYGLGFSFGYYALLYGLAPSGWLQDPALAARWMNGLGVVAAALLAIGSALFLRELGGTVAALAATLLFLLSPVMLPAVMSGHPLMLALALYCFGGCALLRAAHAGGTGRWLWRGAAALLLVAGLCTRAEIVLGFPLLWLAGLVPERRELRAGWRPLLGRALLLSGCFAVFLWLQRSHLQDPGGAGGSLIAFLSSFVSAGRVPRGMAVLGLALGLASGAALAWVLWETRRRGGAFRGSHAAQLPLAMAAVLALPALLLWLPVPQPARHFLFPVFAACWLLGTAVAARWHRPLPVVVATLLLVLANQLTAEVLRPLIVTRYSWSYSALGERRVTQQVPLGAFWLDQPANQQEAEHARREALSVAAHVAKNAPPHLLVLADNPFYLVAELIAADPALRWSHARVDGVDTLRLASATREVVMVTKYTAWPRDVVAFALSHPAWADWPVYEQAATRTRFDVAQVPPGRVFMTLPP